MATKKKSTKEPKEEKLENLNDANKYKGKGKLIQDMPSQPLIVEKLLEPTPVPAPVKVVSNKEMYYKMVMEGLNFILKYNGSIIYDSEGKLSKVLKDLAFENNGFTLYGKPYSYDGLSFQYKRK